MTRLPASGAASGATSASAPAPAPPPAAALLHAAESALVQHRAFGDSAYIRSQLAVSYRRRLRKLQGALPAAGQLADLLDAGPAERQHALMGDTVLRCAIQHAMRQVTLGDEYGLPLAQCAALFDTAAQHWRTGLPGGPLLAHMPATSRLAEPAQHGDATHIWYPPDQQQQDDAPPAYAAAFLAVIEHNYGGPLCTPTPDDMMMLRRGLALLNTLLPRLARSALSHVQVIALFPLEGVWRGKASSSQFRVNGCFFLNRTLINNPWWLAEHLLHEALHQKLYEFRHGHTLLAPGYEREGAPVVCSLWNAPDDARSNEWDAHRTLAAFHVYVQLALLCLVAEQREQELAPRYGPIGARMSSSRRAIDRARYLGEQLHLVMWPELGLAGQQMTDWLLDVLDLLDVQPRPAGATLHLLLDLYERQNRKLDLYLASKANTDGQLYQQQAEREAQAALAALQAAGQHQAQQDLQAQLSSTTLDWPQTRKIVLQALRQLTEENRGDEGSNAQTNKVHINKVHINDCVQKMVLAMVQQSSRQLTALGALS